MRLFGYCKVRLNCILMYILHFQWLLLEKSNWNEKMWDRSSCEYGRQPLWMQFRLRSAYYSLHCTNTLITYVFIKLNYYALMQHLPQTSHLAVSSCFAINIVQETSTHQAIASRERDTRAYEYYVVFPWAPVGRMNMEEQKWNQNRKQLTNCCIQ